MDTLRKLLARLRISEEHLVITNEITGAGYIVDNEDNVLCRWGHIHEGIATLEAYYEASLLPFDTELEPSGRLTNNERFDGRYYT